MLNLLNDLQGQLGISYIFISHDLSVVRHVADRVAVMYLGRIIESGPTEAVFERPNHPYTAALMSAAPTLDGAQRRERILLKGEVPSPLNPPSGCRFRTRCWKATEICATAAPPNALDLEVVAQRKYHPLLEGGWRQRDALVFHRPGRSLASALRRRGFGIVARRPDRARRPTPYSGTPDMIATVVTLMVVVRERRRSTCTGPAGRWSECPAPSREHCWRCAAASAGIPGRVSRRVALTSSAGSEPHGQRRWRYVGRARHRHIDRRPPMALIWQGKSGARLRGTMSGFFLVGSVMSIAALAATGAVDGHTFWAFAVLIPAAVAGYALSRGINRFLDPTRLRRLAIGVSTLGAVVLIGRELLAMGA